MDFGLLSPHFCLFQGIFRFIPWSCCWPIHCSIMCYLASISLCVSVFLWLISSFIVLCSGRMLDMISVFLNLLRFVLCHNMWSIRENVPCAFEKYVYSSALGWNALKTSIKSIWPSMLVKATVSLLIFWLEDLSFEVNEVLKSPTMTVLLLISPYIHQDLLYIFRCPYVGCIKVYRGYILLWIAPFIIM